jgi:hypothetical protein
MKRPISKGDLCEVIDGVYKSKSPNIGKMVTVESLQGNHSQLGVIWRCSGPNLVAFNDDGMGTGTADFPAIWLRRIDPPPMPVKELELERVT